MLEKWLPEQLFLKVTLKYKGKLTDTRKEEAAVNTQI